MNKIKIAAVLLTISGLSHNFASAADIQPAVAEFEALHFAKAKQLFSAAVSDPQHKKAANYYLGRIAVAGGRYAEARDYFEASVGVQPNNADELYWLSTACGALLQREMSLELFTCYLENVEAAVKINPSHLLSLLSLQKFHATQPSLAGASRERAGQLLSKIETISKASADVARLAVLNNDKEIDKAVALAQTMVVSHPAAAQALFEAGKTLSNNKRYPEALVAFQKAIAVKPAIGTWSAVQGSYFEIGQVSLRTKTNLDQGIAALSKAVDPEIFPINGYTNWSYWRLSQLAKLKGDSAQQNKYLALLEKTGVAKEPLLLKDMER